MGNLSTMFLEIGFWNLGYKLAKLRNKGTYFVIFQTEIFGLNIFSYFTVLILVIHLKFTESSKERKKD